MQIRRKVERVENYEASIKKISDAPSVCSVIWSSVLAMKHFRAAYALDPTYIPARYNMEQYGNMCPSGRCAYTEEDCPVQNDSQFKVVYDEHHVGHLVRK